MGQADSSYSPAPSDSFYADSDYSWDAYIHAGCNNFTIVLTDIVMPHMDGIQLLKYIREYHPKNGVIVITGVSIGIARFVRHTGSSRQEDIADRVARADKTLYSAENQGKNRVVTDEVY